MTTGQGGTTKREHQCEAEEIMTRGALESGTLWGDAGREESVRMGGGHGSDAAAAPAVTTRGWDWGGVMLQRLQRWVFLYNVTTGLYMLDRWERCLFNAVFVVFFLVACYNSGHYLRRLGAVLLGWCSDDAAMSFALGRGVGDGFPGGGVGGAGVTN